MYEKYKHPNNDGLYAFVEAPSGLLDTHVPVEARNALDKDGNPKLIKDYLTLSPQISLDGTTCIILLNESIEDRLGGVNEADLAFWDEALAPYGLGEVSWLTIEEYSKLRASDKYSDGEDC